MLLCFISLAKSYSLTFPRICSWVSKVDNRILHHIINLRAFLDETYRSYFDSLHRIDHSRWSMVNLGRGHVPSPRGSKRRARDVDKRRNEEMAGCSMCAPPCHLQHC